MLNLFVFPPPPPPVVGCESKTPSTIGLVGTSSARKMKNSFLNYFSFFLKK
jgi:hypothetical protein